MLEFFPLSIVIASTLLFQVSAGDTPSGDSVTTEPSVQRSVEMLQDATSETKQGKYQSAKEAFGVGVAFYNARNYKEAREPLEAFVQMTNDPKERLKAYRALFQSYRLIPEFEPFQKAAEYVIERTESDAERSLIRSSFISFAFQRGQLDSLAKRYEARLAEDRDNFLSVYMLSEIYTTDDRNPKRAIELLQQLEKLNAAKRLTSVSDTKAANSAEGVKIAREKAKLARQYSQANEHLKAAELYAEIAPLDSTTQAWNFKDAAAAYLKAGNKEKALEMALAAEKAKPEARNDQLTHFFHRNLGDVFMQLAKPKQAIPHYEIAVQKTNIEGYVKDTKASLQEAIELSGK
jgi:tetratricopeptide (TPR) repeat protein